MSAKEHLEELLSGFLDGELNADELQQVQSAMAADATLGEHVEQLKQLGNDLRRIPQQRLPRDFSQRVLAAAQAEAARAEGGSTTASYVYPAQVAESRDSRAHSGAWYKTAASLAAIAATLLFAAYLSGWLPTGIQQTGSGELVENKNEENNNEDATGTPDLMLPLPVDSEPTAGEIVRNEIKRQGSNDLGIEYLTVYEIRPTVEAWQSNTIASLLQEVGIEWSSPVKASNDLIVTLNETRSISRGIPNGEGDQVALVLVRASGLKVEKAMMNIWNRESQFPHVFMDVAFDIPGKEMVRKLTEAQRGAFADARAIATPIIATSTETSSSPRSGLANATQFSAAPTDRYVTDRNVPNAARARPLTYGSPVTSDDEEELTYLLLVIRKPTE